MTTQETLLGLIREAARDTHPRYARFVDADDLCQEVAVYAYGDGWKRLEKLVEAGDTAKALRSLFAAARLYCEREKARVSGYALADVAWYTPDNLAGLVDVAFDESWDGLTGEGDDTGGRSSASGREGGTLLAMVVDVRRALAARKAAAHVLRSSGDLEQRGVALRELAEFLGGESPRAGLRQRKAEVA